MGKAINVRVVSDRAYDDEVLNVMINDNREYGQVTRDVILNMIAISTGCNIQDNTDHINNFIYKLRMTHDNVNFIIEGASYDYNVYLRMFDEIDN